VRSVRIALLVAGVALLVVLVVENNPSAILASVRQLSWRLGIVLCFPAALVAVLDALGWRFAFAEDRVGIGTLMWARLAGEAFNLTTPTANVGGEAIKALLLRGRVPLSESLPSVIVAKTTITIAQALFLAVGIAVAWSVLPHDAPLLHGISWLLAIEVLALGAFVAAQMSGTLGSLVARLATTGWLGAPGRAAALRRVDVALGRFYRREPWRLTVSIAAHFLAWVLGVVETYLILRFIGIGVSWRTATIIESFGTAIKIATFLVPASVGVLEGGFVAVFAAFGLSAASGISFSLIRRAREIAWVGLGLIAFWAGGSRGVPPTGDVPGAQSFPARAGPHPA
jgi:uncharacterized protein (TIRG00374 family)